MRLAYVVTVYKQPSQFARLLHMIWHPDDVYAVHVDAKVPMDLRAAFVAAATGRPNVRFVESLRVSWGGFGLCEAEWRALTWLVREAGPWDCMLNITGQDFPLKRRDQMVAELARRPGVNYMQIRNVRDLPFHFRRRAYFRCVEFRDKVRRLPIPNLPPRGFRNRWFGSGFHILTRDFCDWLVAAPHMDECRSYFRHTWHPHEHWLQAMMMASPFRETVDPDNKRLIRWTRGSGNPNILTSEDLPELEGATAFFGRKFDETVDANVLDALERRLRPFRIAV